MSQNNDEDMDTNDEDELLDTHMEVGEEASDEQESKATMDAAALLDALQEVQVAPAPLELETPWVELILKDPPQTSLQMTSASTTTSMTAQMPSTSSMNTPSTATSTRKISPSQSTISHRSSRSHRGSKEKVKASKPSPDMCRRDPPKVSGARAKAIGSTPASSTTSSASRSTLDGQEQVGMQSQMFFKGGALPWNARGVAGIARLLMVWIAAIYTCPYDGCTFVSPHSKKGKWTIKPDRTCDFLQHWWTTHMAATLKFRCMIQGCAQLHVLYKTVHSYRQHLLKHFQGAKVTDSVISGHVSTCYNDFIENASDEPDPKVVSGQVKYPDDHISMKLYSKLQADEEKARKVQNEKEKREETERQRKEDQKRAEDERLRLADEKRSADALARAQEEAR